MKDPAWSNKIPCASIKTWRSQINNYWNKLTTKKPYDLRISCWLENQNSVQELRSSACSRAHEYCRGSLFSHRAHPSSPTESRFRKFSSITSWYSFLWAKSSSPISSSVKTTATSLKVTASYNINHTPDSCNKCPWRKGNNWEKWAGCVQSGSRCWETRVNFTVT